MRVLTSALTAAQKARVRHPHVEVKFRDYIAAVRRLAYTRLYTGAEIDNWHAACMPDDGSLIRLRINTGAGQQLQIQRVANPDVGSNFATWVNFQASVQGNIGVALAASGARVIAVYMTTTTNIRFRESTDNGVTFSADAAVTTSVDAVNAVSVAVKSNGDIGIFWQGGANTVRSIKRVAGAWQAVNNSGYNILSTSPNPPGIGCWYSGDFNLIMAGRDGTDTTQDKVWSAIYGDGFAQALNTWSALREIARTDSGALAHRRRPSLSKPDNFRATYVEKSSGAGAYARPQQTFTPPLEDYSDNAWREPFPFNLTSDFGLAHAHKGTLPDYHWLTRPDGVWRAPMAVPEHDATATVLSVRLEERPFRGSCRIVLDNADGSYNSLTAESASGGAIKIGAEVRVSPGLVTAVGPQVSLGPAYWITRISQVSGGGRRTVEIEGKDGWHLLEQWRAREEVTWPADTTVLAILQFLCGRAGLAFSTVSSSSQAQNFRPNFTTPPGETGFSAVKRLLELVPDVIRMDGEFAYLLNPLAADAAVYTYGEGHDIMRGAYAQELADNRFQVYGGDTGANFAERNRWSGGGGIEDAYDRLHRVRDQNATAAESDSIAGAQERTQEMVTLGGEIEVPVNCGQQLYDVIAITDKLAGLSSATRRIAGITLRHNRRGPITSYNQAIELMAP